MTAFIDESSKFEGKYSFAGRLILNGQLQGDIDSTGTLVVGAPAVLQARIRARVVIVHGEITGDIVAAERAELRAGARVFGALETPTLLVEEGAVIQGRIHMTQESRDAATRPA